MKEPGLKRELTSKTLLLLLSKMCCGIYTIRVITAHAPRSFLLLLLITSYFPPHPFSFFSGWENFNKDASPAVGNSVLLHCNIWFLFHTISFFFVCNTLQLIVKDEKSDN